MTEQDRAPAKRRKDTIIDEATRLFAERGYAASSMADLAASVGLRKASLFHHFPSKDELYNAVLERIMEGVAEPISSALTDNGSFPERLDRLNDGFVSAFGHRPFAARLVAREMMDWGPFARSRFDELVAPALRVAESFIESGQQAGAFVRRDIRQLLLSLLSLHVLPFAAAPLVQAMTKADASSNEFIDARRAELRDQVRALMLVPVD